MGFTLFLLVILILISSGQLQGDSSTCSYPYRQIGSYCYYFSTNTASWDEAYLNCLHKGGYLANLEAFNEYMILRSWLAGMNNGHHYSIGGRDIMEGDWRWVKNGTFTKMSYFAFGPTEPTVSKSQKCLWLYAGYNYNVIDVSCSSKARYICEK